LTHFPVPMFTHSPVLSFKIQNFIIYLLTYTALKNP
jgi:hypothetical protein